MTKTTQHKQWDKEAGSYWSKLCKTAMLTKNPNRGFTTLDSNDADALVSDLMIKWFGYSEERITAIMSHPEANLFAFLNKCIKEEILLPKSKHNWIAIKEVKTTSIDANIGEDGYTLKDTIGEEDVAYEEVLLDIIREAANKLSPKDKKWFLANKIDEVSTRKIASMSGVSASTVSISVRKSNRMVERYMKRPSVAERINQHLN